MQTAVDAYRNLRPKLDIVTAVAVVGPDQTSRAHPSEPGELDEPDEADEPDELPADHIERLLALLERAGSDGILVADLVPRMKGRRQA